jgi:hypothetical protein
MVTLMIGAPSMLVATVKPERQLVCPVFHDDTERSSSLLKLVEVRCGSHLIFDIFFNMLLIGNHVF